MGVDIPGKKHVRYALRYIHGIGPKRADDVLAACNVEPMKKADDLSQDEIHAIVTFIQVFDIVPSFSISGNMEAFVMG